MSFCKFSIVLKYINENAAFPLEIVFNQKMEKQCNRYIHTYIHNTEDSNQSFSIFLNREWSLDSAVQIAIFLILSNNEPASEN